MSILTKSEYAASKGWSKPYVSKLARQGRLVLTAEGKVDVLATEQQIQRTADPSKAGVAERHQRARIEKAIQPQLRHDAPLELDDNGELIDFQKARARREHYLANLAEAESLKKDGQLVERAAVEQAAFTSGRLLRDLLLGLPRQISAELAALSDPWELERQLTLRLRSILDDAQQLGQTDLEHCLAPE